MNREGEEIEKRNEYMLCVDGMGVMHHRKTQRGSVFLRLLIGAGRAKQKADSQSIH